MKPVLDTAVPALVIVSMTVVGLGLTVADFLRAVTVLGRVEFAVFAAAYFVCQVPLLLTAVVVFRSFRVAEMDMTAEASRP